MLHVPLQETIDSQGRAAAAHQADDVRWIQVCEDQEAALKVSKFSAGGYDERCGWSVELVLRCGMTAWWWAWCYLDAVIPLVHQNTIILDILYTHTE